MIINKVSYFLHFMKLSLQCLSLIYVEYFSLKEDSGKQEQLPGYIKILTRAKKQDIILKKIIPEIFLAERLTYCKAEVPFVLLHIHSGMSLKNGNNN